MTNGGRASVDIHLAFVDLELVQDDDALRSKRFIDLENVHIID